MPWWSLCRAWERSEHSMRGFSLLRWPEISGVRGYTIALDLGSYENLGNIDWCLIVFLHLVRVLDHVLANFSLSKCMRLVVFQSFTVWGVDGASFGLKIDLSFKASFHLLKFEILNLLIFRHRWLSFFIFFQLSSIIFWLYCCFDHLEFLVEITLHLMNRRVIINVWRRRRSLILIIDC